MKNIIKHLQLTIFYQIIGNVFLIQALYYYNGAHIKEYIKYSYGYL